MSGSNKVSEDITLDELSRLIRILGMLGSNSDGEVVAAARFAVRWVAEHQTSWEALLVPEPEPGVVAVVAVPDANEATKLEEAAYREGYANGMKAMAAQVKAQAAQATQGYGNAWMGASGLGATLGGAAQQASYRNHPSAQGPVRAPGGLHGQGYAQGSWQAVAQALLDLDASGVPAVFRGSREQQFVADVLARGFRTLTPAQEVWLRDIAGRNGMNW